jgi:hypothetical protein
MQTLKEIIQYLVGISILILCIANFKLALIIWVSSIIVIMALYFLASLYDLVINYKIIPIKVISWYWLSKSKKNYKNKLKRNDYKYYKDYLNSKSWQDIRSHAKSAMQSKCEFCNSMPVQVHHIFYPPKKNRGCEGISSLIVVCDKCHKTLHGSLYIGLENVCPLCLTNANNIKLKVNIKHYEVGVQYVCNDCYQIAIGRRYKTQGLTFNQYLKFVQNWQLELYKKIN